MNEYDWMRDRVECGMTFVYGWVSAPVGCFENDEQHNKQCSSSSFVIALAVGLAWRRFVPAWISSWPKFFLATYDQLILCSRGQVLKPTNQGSWWRVDSLTNKRWLAGTDHTMVPLLVPVLRQETFDAGMEVITILVLSKPLIHSRCSFHIKGIARNNVFSWHWSCWKNISSMKDPI